ncbi:MAG: endonuclease/exonuclease/phosphatase family protein [Planctomycetota bacterium]|nr:endonuclease/exonuclease/phosphatase family protein [Planctomycetota bacterium]
MATQTSLVGVGIRVRHVLAALVAALLTAGIAPAWAGNLFDENLIANGDAEQGPAAAAGQRVAATGWNYSAGATVQEYNAFFPAPAQRPGAGDFGKRCFHGGLAGDSALFQNVDLWAGAIDVDADKVGFELAGCFGGLGGRDDYARLTARFLDAGGKALAGTSIGGVTAADRGSVTGLREAATAGRVPPGTRAVALTLRLNRQGSEGANHAAADNLRLVLRRLDAPPPHTLRVLTLDLQGAATVLHAANAIQLADADLVALQEPGESLAAIAAQLGCYHHVLRPPAGPAILSRFPIARTSTDSVEVQPFPGPGVCLFNVVLPPLPTIGALVKRASTAADREAAAVARAAHNADVQALLAQAEPHVKAGQSVFLAGEFNEPSHLDWTASTSAMGRHGGRIVAWPTSQALLAGGLKDVFRALHADELDHPGLTFPLAPAAGQDEGDRLDFIYYTGPALRPASVQLLGPDSKAPHLSYAPFPSGRRGLVAAFTVSPPVKK